MGLRCLIGHDYGPAETTADRDDHGDEIVVSVREFRECTRCGHRKVISENTEVTAKPDGDDAAEGARPSPGAGEDAGPELDDVTAEEDDGVILEDDGEPPGGRSHGEWPEVDEGTAGAADGDPQAWPEAGGEDEGFAAEPGDGGGVEDVDFRGGLTPEPTADSQTDDLDDDEIVEAPDDARSRSPAGAGMDASAGPGSGDEDAGFTSADLGPSTAGEQRLSAAETEVVCPECGHTAPGQATSLRPGDICPECRHGYLTERALE